MLMPILGDVRSVLSLGYPDINVVVEELENLFHIKLEKRNPARPQLADTVEFFERIGKTFVCCDVKRLRGCEIEVDLNVRQQLPMADLVIDPGTLEHCFNIGIAALNAADAVKPNGYIFHDNPVSMINHGFYMLCPTWYWDFYRDNGWSVVQKATDGNEIWKVHPTERAHAPPELSNLVIARRPGSSNPMKWPVQTKYKRMLS